MKPQYEGWYMKQQQDDDVFAVIAGRSTEEAYLQIVTPNESYFIPYPLASFRHHEKSLQVGESFFTPAGMNLHVHEPGINIEGRFQFSNLTPLRYDIMGPFALLPMETKHIVFSMRHHVEGTVTFNGKTHPFHNAVGYMEGDQGHSFPQGYTWLQSVDLPHNASVMLAIATIPLGLIHFTGCIGVVSLDDKEYRFATYLGVHIEQSSETCVAVSQGELQLRVDIPKTRGHRLQAPLQGTMQKPIRESPAVPARFLFKKGEKTLLESEDALTSFEYVKP